MKNDEPFPELIIQPSRGWFRVPWREVWEYRNLLWQLVRRDFALKYRQALLGPLWFILQPLLLTSVFAIVFGRLAHLPTDDAPPVLFYLSGLLSWSYFAQTMPTIATTFSGNNYLFSKIYFPRLVVPLSVVTSNLVALTLQFATFAGLWSYYRFFTSFGFRPLPSPAVIVTLLLTAQIQIMVLALGMGSLLAAATGKYRDLQHVLPVVMQLWFYATPIVYPLSMVSSEARWRWVSTLNPMTAPAEAIKFALLGKSQWTPQLGLTAWAMSLVLLLLGLSAFSRAERTVVDVA